MFQKVITQLEELAEKNYNELCKKANCDEDADPKIIFGAINEVLQAKECFYLELCRIPKSTKALKILKVISSFLNNFSIGSRGDWRMSSPLSCLFGTSSITPREKRKAMISLHRMNTANQKLHRPLTKSNLRQDLPKSYRRLKAK